MALKKEIVSSDAAEVYEKNFLDVFAILIIQLRLNGETEKGWRNLIRNNHPFSFETADALKEMENLELLIELRLVTTTIRYAIRTDLAAALLSKFFDAHLLHDPTSRTISSLKLGSRVQITPKGAALVYEFCKNIGMREDKIPAVVFSNINTMQLFHFDRSPISGEVLHSEYLNHVLLTTLMGTEPNVWYPDKEPASSRNLFYEESNNNGDFFIDAEHISKGKLKSPFYHRYFSNPQSDAHIQYYENHSGVRLFHNKQFNHEGSSTIVEYCFSGKALVQWLCDCSTLNSIGEATQICQLLLDQNLITSVTVSRSPRCFYNHLNAIYMLSEVGSQSCRWWNSKVPANPDLGSEARDLENDLFKSGNFNKKQKNVNLGYVLADPGMRYLFRVHLEKESCLDNFEAYFQLHEFISRRKACGRLLRHAVRAERFEQKMQLRQAIENFATSNTLLAFHIYSKYFSLESVYNLNIDFSLQQQLDCTIANVEKSPISPTRGISHDISMYVKTPDIENCFNQPEESDLGQASIDNESCTLENKFSDKSSSSTTCSGSVEHSLKLGNDESRRSCGDVSGVDFKKINADSEQLSSLEESIEALVNIWRVFEKVANSLYRMMESDLFPKFLRSLEYLIAMEAISRST